MNRATATACLLFACAPALAGCVEKNKELSASEREQLKAHVSKEAPSPEHTLDVSFEDKVELLGYDASTDEWQPGKKVKITWYWHSKKALDDGWKLFTHIADDQDEDKINQDSSGVIRRLYQPGRWKKGEYIEDVQEITLPSDWSSSRATFYLGLWNGPHRLKVTKGPHDGDNRVRALSLKTGRADQGADSGPQLPTLAAHKAEEDIEIDGKLDEGAWKQAPRSDRFVHPQSGAKADPKATAKMLWDDEHLYVGVHVADDFLQSTFEEHDDELWKQDAVEVFVDPDGDGKNYFEMQVSPMGVVFDTRYDAPRKPKAPGHKDWDSGLKAKVDLEGEANDDEEDEGYTVEMAIPWKAFAIDDDDDFEKPSANDTWRVNFFVVDARKEDDAKRYVAWSAPRKGDFHVPERFGRVRFVDPAQQANAAAAKKRGDLLPRDAVERIRKNMAGNLQPQKKVKRPKPGEKIPRIRRNKGSE